MIEVNIRFEFDNFVTDKKCEKIATRYGGYSTGRGFGPDGRDIDFEFPSQAAADRAILDFYKIEKVNIEVRDV